MLRSKMLTLHLTLAQWDWLQVAIKNCCSPLDRLNLRLKTSIGIEDLEELEELTYSLSPKNTREFITREAILNKIVRLRLLAEAEAAEVSHG